MEVFDFLFLRRRGEFDGGRGRMERGVNAGREREHGQVMPRKPRREQRVLVHVRMAAHPRNGGQKQRIGRTVAAVALRRR